MIDTYVLWLVADANPSAACKSCHTYAYSNHEPAAFEPLPPGTEALV
jgi:hypothetical protein